MKDTLLRLFPALIGAGRQLHSLDEGQRAVANQRPFLIAVGFACVIALLVSPGVFSEGLFLLGLTLTLLSRLPGAVLSWQAFGPLLYWLIPLLQFAAIAALRAGGGDTLLGLSMIAVFPVIWLAWFARHPAAVHAVNFAAALVIVWLPIFLDRDRLTVQTLAAPLLIPVILWVIGMFTVNVSQSIDAQQDELRIKDEELREAVAKSEEHAQLLDAIIETVPVGVVVVDAEGNDKLMNSHQRKLHELAIPDDVPDPREDQLLIFGRDKTTAVPAPERPVRRAIDGSSFTHQLIWVGDHHRRRALSASASGMKDSAGAPAGSVIVFNDVTELVEALEAKDGFLHSVTHELRTPLTSILGYIDLALEETESMPSSETFNDSLRVAERNAIRLLALVSDLLATASGPTIEVRTADLAVVIRSSLDLARPQAEAAGITLVDGAPQALWGVFDPDRMHQVLDNLISNAIKYSSAGDSITVEAEEEGGSLNVRVVDTGRGITEEEQIQIFDKFFRSSNVRESTIPGLGLGLAIAKGVVEAHHGAISVDSAPGQGTTFIVTVPASAGA